MCFRVSQFVQVVTSHFKPYEAHSSESLRRDNKMILFALITACHDRSHSYLCIQAQLACNDISQQWTLRQAINKADELQTAAAIFPELLMDRILIVSANTWVTFYMTLEASPHTYSGRFFHRVCQNNAAESGGGRWVLGWRSWRDKLLWLPQVGTWRGRGVTSRAVMEECPIYPRSQHRCTQMEYSVNETKTCQNYPHPPPPHSMCFNTCGFLCCLHLHVSLCCVSQAQGRPEELSYHNISVKYYILFLMTAMHRITITKGWQWWLVWKTKHIVLDKSMHHICVWSHVFFALNPVAYLFHSKIHSDAKSDILQKIWKHKQ